jgi:hypothetical protein
MRKNNINSVLQAIESGFPVHETPTGEFTLEDFEKELKKATEG